MSVEQYDQWVALATQTITDRYNMIKSNPREYRILSRGSFGFQMPIDQENRMYQWGSGIRCNYGYLSTIGKPYTAFTMVQHALYVYAKLYVIDTTRSPQYSNTVYLTISFTPPVKKPSLSHCNNNYDPGLMDLVTESL